MNSNDTSRVGVLDALTAGLGEAARRPWLLLVPAVIDFVLWMAPRLSVGDLLKRLVDGWEALILGLYTPEQVALVADMITMVQEATAEVGSQLNLAEMMTGNWLGVSSVVSINQASRLTLISDIVLAPMGFSLRFPGLVAAPWQDVALSVSSFWSALVIGFILWLVGQVLVVIYLRWAAANRLVGEDSPWAGVGGFSLLMLWLVVWGVLLGIGLLLLRLPLLATATVMVLAGGGTTSGVLFALVGGVTLWLTIWFLVSFFFVGEALLLDGHSLWRSVVMSISMVRMNHLPTLGLVVVVNVVLLGFRAVWGILGRSPVGAMIAILGNAYLVTSMVLGIFVYYEDLRDRWWARLAEHKDGQGIGD